jgi:hypothetical protein
MNQTVLREHYQSRGFSAEKTNRAIEAIERFESYLEEGVTLDNLSVKSMKHQLQGLIARQENDLETLLALARYVHVIGRMDLYIYFTSVLGGVGVMDHIRSTLALSVGESIAQTVFEGTEVPLGSDPSLQPAMTQKVMQRMATHVDESTMCRVLAGNHHEIPASAYAKEREAFLNSSSLDAYLADFHARQVAVLQHHADTQTVWFEQRITSAVVDFVANNQELLSAVRSGNHLLMTKIPYDPDTYLKSNDPIERRYLACHCPLAREAIITKTAIDPHWCYCSGGFEKFPFEVIFDQPLSVKVLESVLGGAEHCRFEVALPEGWEQWHRA